jgi:hypothetical protein
MEVFASGHWAASRSRCPACGGRLEPIQAGDSSGFAYEHYDSSTDIRFDMDQLLSPAQIKETRLVFWLGVALVLISFGLRLGFVFLGGFEGFWFVPWWFDAIVVLMLSMAVVMIVWAVRRLVRHRSLIRKTM